MPISLDDPLELGRLRMSIGYGRNKKKRPLSPIQVGKRIREARQNGFSLRECSEVLHLDGTGHIGRFLRILELPRKFHDQICWGREAGKINFSTAVEIGTISNSKDQHTVCKSILADNLTRSEVRQVAQLRSRSNRPIDECLKEIISMRPIIEKQYVFVGKVGSSKAEAALVDLTQMERDVILQAYIKKFNVPDTTGKLGPKFFTLVGGPCFDSWMNCIGKGKIETQFRSFIQKMR